MTKRDNNGIDVSLDLLGTKALAVAAEHASKSAVDGVGKFLSAICMPAAEEIGLVLRDQVARLRRKNLEAIVAKTEAKLAAQGETPTGSCSPLLIRNVIEDASWIDDDCIQDMWAGLLATAAVSNADDSVIYTDVLKRLSPFQARVINLVYGDPRAYSSGPYPHLNSDADYSPREPLVYPVEEILSLHPGDLSHFVNIAGVTHDRILNELSHHYIAIGRFRPQLDSLVALGLVRVAQITAPTQGGEVGVLFQPALKGLDLYMRGQGYMVYPLEAFIATQAHHFHMRGMSQFARDLKGRRR